MAPEIMKGVYDQKCDVWSAAVKKMTYTFDIP